MVDEENLDAGQSAFWENQSLVQAPPIEPESPNAKKKRILILAGSSLFILLLVVMVAAPRKNLIGPPPTPKAVASPTPIPLQSEIVQEFNAIDGKINRADLETIIAPPQLDMLVNF